MDSATKWIIGVVVVVILGIGAYALMGHNTPAPTTGTDTGTDTGTVTNPPADTGGGTTGGGSNPVTGTGNGDGPATGSTALVVTYTNSGFSPALLDVSVGQKVTFVDKSSSQMWVASDPHPTHQGYDGTTEPVHCANGYTGPAPFDECQAADTFTFTFTKAGTWGYHNHFNSSAHGTIVVSPGASSTN